MERVNDYWRFRCSYRRTIEIVRYCDRRGEDVGAKEVEYCEHDAYDEDQDVSRESTVHGHN